MTPAFAVGDAVLVTFPEPGQSAGEPRPAVVKEVRQRQKGPAYLVQLDGRDYTIEVWETALERKIKFREFL